jgi:spermidine synthase
MSDSEIAPGTLPRGGELGELGSSDASSGTTTVIVALFLLSGACSLIYEIVWLRMLVLVFGMSVFAVSTVLTAFMAGLALGSVVFGRLIDKRGSPLRVYAYLELGIGFFALIFPLVLARLDDVYTLLYRQLGSDSYAFHAIRFALCFLVLLVPTTLMGGTLPVLSRFVVQRRAMIGRGVGGLYAINTLGAAAGCFAAAYLLMEWVGTMGTTYVAAGGNLLIAGVALLLIPKHREPQRSPAATVDPRARTEADAASPSPWMIRLVFWGFAISGFTALGYEVVWTRLLCMVLHITTIQSVSTLLIAYLFGLAAGAAVGTRFVDRWKKLCPVFGVVEILLGVFGLGSIAVLGLVPHLLEQLDALYTWWGHILKLFIVAFGVMLIPTLLMGLLFPIAGRIQVLALRHLGQRIGNVYAANTSGAILGAFAAGFVLVPLLGAQPSLQILAAINVAVGAAVLLLSRSARLRTRLAILGGLAVPILLLAVRLPSDLMIEVYRRAQPQTELVYYDEAAAGTVTVYEYENGSRLLKVNGAGEVPTDHRSIQTFRLLGTLPMVVHPDPEEVLVIAFGGGVTLAAVELQRPRRIDCVEVVPGVVEAAQYFTAYNNLVYQRLGGPGVNVIADDGRNHVLRTERQYDVIISDSTHPGTADSWVLYTDEFYRLCKRRLKEGGIVAQWLPMHGLTAEDYQTILRTFRGVFPHTTVWQTGQYSIMLATPERPRFDYRLLEKRLGPSDVKANLAEVNLDDPMSLLAALILDEDALGRYVGDGNINTDDRPYVSFFDRSRTGTQSGLPVMINLLPYLSDSIDNYLVNVGRQERVRIARRCQSRRHTFLGQVALRAGDREGAVMQLQRARQVDPDEREAKRILSRLEASRARH